MRAVREEMPTTRTSEYSQFEVLITDDHTYLCSHIRKLSSSTISIGGRRLQGLDISLELRASSRVLFYGRLSFPIGSAHTQIYVVGFEVYREKEPP